MGVLPQGFRFIGDVDAYYPLEQGPGNVRNAHMLFVVGRLAAPATLTSAHAEMTHISQSLLATYGNQTQAVDADLLPLQDYFVGGYRVLLSIVFAGAILVLLIACTNLLSAQLARGLSRRREIAVRAALGAARWRLLRRLCWWRARCSP